MNRTHSLSQCILIVGPNRITEFGESDACRIERMVDAVEPSASADGTITLNVDNNKARIVTITLRQTGYAYRKMAEMAQAQQAALDAGDPIPQVAFSYENLRTGDLASDMGAVFLNEPTIFGNKAVSDVEFRVLLARPKVVYGANVTPPAA